MHAEYHGKSGKRATPQDLQKFGNTLFVERPKALPKGIVALRFDEHASMADAIDVGAQFLNVLGAVPVKRASVKDFDSGPDVSASINAMAAKGGQTLVFYLPDMSQLRRIDLEQANASWGRSLQDAYVLLHMRMP